MAKNHKNFDDLPYRHCVGILVLNAEGKVWTGRRIDEDNGELTNAQQLWQLPQGGIDKDEEPLAAAKRELYEETGIKSVSLLEEAPEWIYYDLPEELLGVALKGKYRGQTQRWFAFRFEGNDDEIAINPPPEGNRAEFDHWKWRPLQDIPDLIVPFKRRVYDQVVAAFSHLTKES